MKIVSVAEMRDLEAATFAAGTPEDELQRRAGRAVAEAVLGMVAAGGAGGRSVVALVGPGNNGRDAWIAAAELRAAGWLAALYLTPRHAITDGELADFVAAGGRLIRYGEGAPSAGTNGDAGMAAAVGDRDVVIDGILGIGTRGAPRPPLDGVIRAVNAIHARESAPMVVAVDNPSGLDADTGAAADPTIQADMTVVLGAAKQGLLSPAAVPFTGRLVFADIGVVAGAPDMPSLIDATISGLLPAPPADAHKYTFGRVLVVAGSERYLGAAYLTSAAAARAGAGVVTVAAPRWLRDVIAARIAEVTYLPLPDAGLAGAADEAVARISSDLGAFSALAIGPGLSLEGGVPSAVESILKERARLGIPAVVDADALNALSTRPDWPSWIGRDVVLTPHLGELRRLVAATPPPVAEKPQVDDEAAAPAWERSRRLAARWGVTLVTKGPFTSVCTGDDVWVHAGPNPALATAGTGDVLTGIIAGLLARGLRPEDAARLAVWVHGQAGAEVRPRYPRGGLLASELLDQIPTLLV